MSFNSSSAQELAVRDARYVCDRYGADVDSFPECQKPREWYKDYLPGSSPEAPFGQGFRVLLLVGLHLLWGVPLLWRREGSCSGDKTFLQFVWLRYLSCWHPVKCLK